MAETKERYQFHRTILREYDVRGIIDETLSPDDARWLGKAYGTILKRGGGTRVAVGFDGRLSSPDLERALVEGLTSTGIEALRIGMGPTPMLYFAVHHLGADGGVQVTGSHNPPNHNGFKMMLGTKPFFGARIQELGQLAASGDVEQGDGRAEFVDLFTAYVDRLARDYHGTRPIKAVWDCGNGATGPATATLVHKLAGEHSVLFAEVDGTFPNHHPDPTIPHNLEALIETVKREGAEIGIAFDGDGDRIGVVDGQGRILFGDQMMQILAEDILARYPGAPILCDVKASQAFFDRVIELGGQAVMWKTGHSLIKNAMAEMGSPLAGEMSGHIFYKDSFYGHDDALYVAVRFLDLLARGERSLAERFDAMPVMVNTPELRFDCDDEQKFTVMQSVKRQVEALNGVEVNDIDGVRVLSEDGWWLLRASNTQAVLVARAEAKDQAGLDRLKQQIRTQLRAAGIEPPAF